MSRMTPRVVSDLWSVHLMSVSSSLKTSRECRSIIHAASYCDHGGELPPAQTP